MSYTHAHELEDLIRQALTDNDELDAASLDAITGGARYFAIALDNLETRGEVSPVFINDTIGEVYRLN